MSGLAGSAARWLGLGPLCGVRRLLLAGIGVVEVCAFGSLAVQLHGLVGERGILPNVSFFARVARHAQFGFADVPSLCWWLGCSDAALTGLCALGLAAGLCLAVGVAPLAAAATAWVAYLSLFYAGQEFLSFQWDLLVLEAGFLAILLAPARALGPRSLHWRTPPSPLAWLLVRWLLFRLVFGSGVVKLTSGDGAWSSLSALALHFETQPLPNAASWWAHQLPADATTLLTAATFALELCVPWLYWGPRPARLAGAVATMGLMVGINLTGNYGFFNLLTVVLCLSLLEDRDLPTAWRVEPGGPSRIARAVLAPVACALFVASWVPIGAALRAPLHWPAPVLRLHDFQNSFRLVNSYGLFATMTTSRPEIEVQGTRDGRSWRTYAFRWKPGVVTQAPRFLLPHMPRLDWQMWFAAIRLPRASPWFASFAGRLIEGEPSVVALLAADPFPEGPPRAIRATLYQYRFTGPDAGAAWWTRRLVRTHFELSAEELR